MPWLWMAIRLKARGSALSPMRSTMRALGQAEPVPRQHLGQDDLAVRGAAGVGRRDAELGAHLAVGRLDAAAVARLAEDAEHAVGRAAQRADDARLVGSGGRCAEKRTAARSPTPKAGAPRSATTTMAGGSP